MRILVTGANGFVGRNLVNYLKCIKEGKNRTTNIKIDDIFEYDIINTADDLDLFCSNCDFVFNLAGVNRPKNEDEFAKGNIDFSNLLLFTLKKHNNHCPIMLSSSIQASLIGNYNTEYGRTKLAGEKLFFDYANTTNTKVCVYRFPNLFGKWSNPNYNSVIATFCNNIANGLPISISDPNKEIEFLYIDDLIHEMIELLENKGCRCRYNGITPIDDPNGPYYYVPTTHKVTLGYIAKMLNQFSQYPVSLIMSNIPDGSFEKKLYSTYLSYLPDQYTKFDYKMNHDERGSFTELLKTLGFGQFSVNISKPGITKGNHWHNSKWELFIVVSGNALIRERKIGTEEVREFYVSGDKIEAVYMLPGYTHSITNLSDSEDLVTLIWANEVFDPNNPDTFSEKV